ncbi:hypothetical protein CGRA01v4_09560 [Colletotrichum graminicola]|nr:hypothetical protein CGRA01v4_09560 [Colletotrichum graminicola]
MRRGSVTDNDGTPRHLTIIVLPRVAGCGRECVCPMNQPPSSESGRTLP